jgi:3-methyladenine DNA glycosylase Mpg
MTAPSFTEALRALVPPMEADGSAYLPAFRAMAALLLQRTTWHIAGVPHRFTEVEFYFNGRKHGDIFTHGDPMQRDFGRWYHHRTAGEYRGGTYKGLDIAFGASDAPAGILVRGIERVDATPALIDGPCMCVDHLLGLHGAPTVQAFAEGFDRSVDPPEAGTSPSYLTVSDAPRSCTVYASPRVGLTLKKGATSARVHFLAQPYRFLSEPSRIKKGRVNLVLGMHRDGLGAADIARATGSAASQVARYTAQYDAGKALDPKGFRSDLSTEALCQLFGACEKFL